LSLAPLIQPPHNLFITLQVKLPPELLVNTTLEHLVLPNNTTQPPQDKLSVDMLFLVQLTKLLLKKFQYKAEFNTSLSKRNMLNMNKLKRFIKCQLKFK
jgi:hypothetical protein